MIQEVPDGCRKKMPNNKPEGLVKQARVTKDVERTVVGENQTETVTNGFKTLF
jgi:hypothetical protein